jgi:hypothetical protein
MVINLQVEDSGLLEHMALLLSGWFTRIQRHYITLKHQKPHTPNNTTSYPRKSESSETMLQELEIS